jgi:hypothetical protein
MPLGGLARRSWKTPNGRRTSAGADQDLQHPDGGAEGSWSRRVDLCETAEPQGVLAFRAVKIRKPHQNLQDDYAFWANDSWSSEVRIPVRSSMCTCRFRVGYPSRCVIHLYCPSLAHHLLLCVRLSFGRAGNRGVVLPPPVKSFAAPAGLSMVRLDEVRTTANLSGSLPHLAFWQRPGKTMYLPEYASRCIGARSTEPHLMAYADVGKLI